MPFPHLRYRTHRSHYPNISYSLLRHSYLRQAQVLHGYRGGELRVTTGPSATEGVGLYVSPEKSFAARFGTPSPISYTAPRYPLLIVDEHLPVLQGSHKLWTPITESDSEWLRINKQAISNLNIPKPRGFDPATSGDSDVARWLRTHYPNLGEEITRIATGKGYDAFKFYFTKPFPYAEVPPGTQWSVLLDKDLWSPYLKEAQEEELPHFLHAFDLAVDETECQIISPHYYDILTWLNLPVPDYSFAIESETKERKIDEVLEKLKDGVARIHENAVFREFLLTMSKFHDYSIGNQILIMLQKPEATRVAGFNTWKDLGRYVKKGEKGISILAPCLPPKLEERWTRGKAEWVIRKVPPEEREFGIFSARSTDGVLLMPPVLAEKFPSKWQAEERLREWGAEVPEIEAPPLYFKVVYVFDVSQTEGKPLPEFVVPVLTGTVNEELFAKLQAHTKEQGLELSFEPKPELGPEVKGYYIGKTIWVRPEEPRAQQLKTLLHETAHYYTESVFLIPKADAETIAESSSFVVGAHFGFDTGVRTFPYVALWSRDKKVLEANLLNIRKVSARMIEALEKQAPPSTPSYLTDEVTPEEWQFAEDLWQSTKELKEARDPYGSLIWQIIDERYPGNKEKQTRFLGFMNDFLAEQKKRHPIGVSPEVLTELARKWGVEMAVVSEAMRFFPGAGLSTLKEQPKGTCYEDAWRFLVKQEEGGLIHGSLQLSAEGKRVQHAWVRLPTGYIWEPQTKQFFTAQDFKILSPIEDVKYTTEEAAIMVARTKNFGPWTEAERKEFLKSELKSNTKWSTESVYEEYRKMVREEGGVGEGIFLPIEDLQHRLGLKYKDMPELILKIANSPGYSVRLEKAPAAYSGERYSVGDEKWVFMSIYNKSGFSSPHWLVKGD